MASNARAATEAGVPGADPAATQHNQTTEFANRNEVTSDNIIDTRTRSEDKNSNVGKENLTEVGENEGFEAGSKDEAMAASFSQDVKGANKASGAA
ncbi:hypothetical protein BJ508DRAFT_411278 [Ascobolus immersus RN42]|uniref:Uncharacterized protein n=1 Tax=Ascobolus immersus RN42 TaxID=1160509 RepID=A0A3N4IY83_ASCIM|nr:hypothetical protein BJ508DRAFT_411278 [Ascobolus immersus RN42]